MLGDVVDEMERDHSRLDAVAHRGDRLHSHGVVRVAERRSLPNGQQAVARQHEQDLLHEEPVLRGNGHGHEQLSEHVVAMALDRRPGSAVARAPQQLVDGARVERGGCGTTQLVRVGIEQVGPRLARHGPERTEGLG